MKRIVNYVTRQDWEQFGANSRKAWAHEADHYWHNHESRIRRRYIKAQQAKRTGQ